MSPASDTEASSSAINLGLLLRIATRDEGALAEFYDRHSTLAYSVIMRILRSPSDAEEVLQETFVRVWSRAETYNALPGVAGRLADTHCEKSCDRSAARPPRPGQRRSRTRSPLSAADAAHSIEPVTRDTPETALAGHAMADAVRAALATLMPEQRELIEAAFFEGYTQHRACRPVRRAAGHGEDAYPHGPGERCAIDLEQVI